MSLDLGLATFKGETAAASAFGTLRAAAKSDTPWTHEVALVEHHHNDRMSVQGTFATHYVDVEETDHVSQPGAAEGALTGALVGAPFGPPGFAAGSVLGGVIGAEVATPSEVEEEPQLLIDELRQAVPRDHSAIVLLAAPAHVDAIFSALSETHAEVTRRALTVAQSSTLVGSVSAEPAASSGPSREGEGAAPTA